MFAAGNRIVEWKNPVFKKMKFNFECGMQKEISERLKI